MVAAFEGGGIMMWPMLAIAAGILALAGRTAYPLLASDTPDPRTETRLQAILFWGVMAVLLGLLGTAVGIIQMAQALSIAGQAEAPLVYGGIAVVLITLVFGMVIFLVAAICWFLLRQAYLRAAARVRRLEA
jgi:biopolymer transport protein ExbB/TolQ